MSGSMPFKADNDCPDWSRTIKKKVLVGLTEQHLKLLNELLPLGKFLVLSCLRKSPEERPTAKDICRDAWLTSARTMQVEFPCPVSITENDSNTLAIATKMKRRLQCELDAPDIVQYIRKNPMGTTAGYFRLVEIMESEKCQQVSKIGAKEKQVKQIKSLRALKSTPQKNNKENIVYECNPLTKFPDNYAMPSAPIRSTHLKKQNALSAKKKVKFSEAKFRDSKMKMLSMLR